MLRGVGSAAMRAPLLLAFYALLAGACKTNLECSLNGVCSAATGSCVCAMPSPLNLSTLRAGAQQSRAFLLFC